MAIVTSFLCWNNTRTGSAVCAYYSLVISVVCVSFYVFRYLAMGEIESAVEYKGIVYPGFVLYTVMIAVSLIMLPGVYMDKKFLLLPWVYTLVVTVLYETGAIALLTTYQELSEGRGTYDYLYKPRRHWRHSLPLADGDIYNTPYGAHLPPYCETNPHKDFNPPDYDNISIIYDNPAFCTQTSGTLRSCLDYEDVDQFQTLRLEISDQSRASTSEVDAREDSGSGSQYSFNAEVHSSPKRDVYRATYVTWI